MPQIDHERYPKSLRTKPVESLRFTIADCKSAIEVNPDNPKNSYYADEIAYCGMELKRRGFQC